MELIQEIPVSRTNQSRLKEVDFSSLEFGKYVSDHMLVCDYDNEKGGWQSPEIIPFSDLTLSPAALGLHYGQTVFEGIKAFRMQDDSISIFQIGRHYERFVRSLERMCMPAPSMELFFEGLIRLLQTDKGWVPTQAGSSLYIRPFIFATEDRFGVKVSDKFKFIIFTGPVPELYRNPIKVKVETEYIRAAKGGTGFAKCGGNYGGAFYPTQLARMQGYDQVLWTTGEPDLLIEESGMMNVFFVIDGTLVTAPLSDTILDGITRDALLTLARDAGLPTAERSVSVKELEEAFRKNSITEAFGAGTAAVVAPIQTIHVNGIDFKLPAYDENSIHRWLKSRLSRLRTGVDEDIYGWNTVI